MKRLDVLALLGTALFGLATTPVEAETYPSRVVTVVVPYPAGGSVDGVARLLAQKLTESYGQSFIVENRAGGAGGIVGANYVAKAAPDGYTLMLTASIHVVTPFLHKAVPYDVVTDFTPISLVASGPLIVSTTAQTPPRLSRNSSTWFARIPTNTPSRHRASARPGTWRSNCSSAMPVSTPWWCPTRAQARH
jgi:tripartite-type tricarboxylate transporter receptor subunit TctC